MSRLLRFWNFIRKHKYLITITIFVVIIGFLDENSMVRRVGNMREMNHLQNEIERYKADYDKNTRKLNDLTANPVEMEKVAREKYLMKKPNEDIYVFEEDSDQIQDQEQN